MAGWRAAMVVVVLVAVAAGTEHPQRAFWPDSEGLTLELQDWLNNPARRALEGLPKLFHHNTINEKSKWGDILGTYLPSTDPDIVDNKECRHDVLAFMRVLANSKLIAAIMEQGGMWPLIMPDSWGKLPDGYLYGHINPWGMQEECTGVVANNTLDVFPPFNVTFTGRYCLVRYIKNATSESSEDAQDQDGHLARVGGLLTYKPGPVFMSYGTCMPSSCLPKDLEASIEAILGGESHLHIDCHLEDEVKPWYSGDIVYTVFLGIMGCLLFFGAVVDISINYFKKQDLRKGPLRFLLIFSFYTNMNKLFHINTKENPEVISCIHGFRVLSMIWVVWGHSYYFQSLASMNLGGLGPVTDSIIDETITGAQFGVDTFFFLSGLLVVYGLLKQWSTTKRINWIMYYLHRFLRLTPPILFTAAFMATIAKFALVGPMADYIERTTVQTCRDHWWVDVLYVGNFVTPDCLMQCWYTAVDTQLYVVAPIVLIPLLYKPKIGAIWLGIVTVVSMIIPMIIDGVYSLPADIVFSDPVDEPAIIDETYVQPWCRAAPYLVGMWAGLLLHHFRDKEVKMKAWQAVLGWMVAATLVLAIIYGVADYDKIVGAKPLPQGVSIAYDGLARVGWSLALLWVVFACHKGYGGPINSFLAHPCWQPLSRLTYCLYLTCLSVQVIYIGAIYTPFYINHLNQFIQTCGALFIGGILAVILSLMSEGPVLGLEKLLFRRPDREEHTKEVKREARS